MRSSFDVSSRARYQADAKSLVGTIVFYGSVALIVLLLGLVSYYAPVAPGLMIAPDTPERSLVRDRPGLFELPTMSSLVRTRSVQGGAGQH
jgi:hypothetical protein